MYAAYRAGDLETSQRYFHPEVFVDVGTRADRSSGRGRDFLLETIASWVAAFDDWREDIEEVRDVDGRVYVVAVQHGRGKETGIELTQRYGIVYDIDDGLIVEMRMFPTAEDAAKSVGLST